MPWTANFASVSAGAGADVDIELRNSLGNGGRTPRHLQRTTHPNPDELGLHTCRKKKMAQGGSSLAQAALIKTGGAVCRTYTASDTANRLRRVSASKGMRNVAYPDANNKMPKIKKKKKKKQKKKKEDNKRFTIAQPAA